MKTETTQGQQQVEPALPPEKCRALNSRQRPPATGEQGSPWESHIFYGRYHARLQALPAFRACWGPCRAASAHPEVSVSTLKSTCWTCWLPASCGAAHNSMWIPHNPTLLCFPGPGQTMGGHLAVISLTGLFQDPENAFPLKQCAFSREFRTLEQASKAIWKKLFDTKGQRSKV